ncbi:hypothetical protein HO173_002875 [Letharia columbiana]|uniref:Uncharacterized protein n=1 Tax=Letharia columbiana TaxID=112416 RepID=A0A8H6G256_9LECA|nr:uncharacterized protein HO173_002875 [Letharia columbiana]KAF6239003.1 hypothetical protein HO173_002875 [Letharia columbiana]
MSQSYSDVKQQSIDVLPRDVTIRIWDTQTQSCVCVCVVEDAVDQASQVKRMDVEGLSAMQD